MHNRQRLLSQEASVGVLRLNLLDHLASHPHRTELMFPRFDGELRDQEDYLVVRTPRNPTYYWGNYLVFPKAPEDGDLRTWRESFQREVGGPPELSHQLFAWCGPPPADAVLQEFFEQGFVLERQAILVATELHRPARPANHVSIRPLESAEDWQQALEEQLPGWADENGCVPEGTRAFLEPLMQRYRAMVQAGLGTWYAAFFNGRIVGDLGIFHAQGVGRYQMVQTHPDFRRQGICSTLLYTAAKEASQRFGLNQLVIFVEEGTAAHRLYQSMGFHNQGEQSALLKRPEQLGALV